MTDPPVIADVALLVARRFRAPLVVVSQDVFPEVAVELKRLDNPALVRLLRARDAPLPRARRPRRRDRRDDARAARGEGRRRATAIVVIPNWVDTTALEPRPRDNAWAREHELRRQVRRHALRATSATRRTSTRSIRAATFLRDLDDLRIVADRRRRAPRRAEGAREAARGRAGRFMGYQPRELLADSLSSADVHVVGLARGPSGYVVPSRLYGILAVGRPVIAAADGDSETAQRRRAGRLRRRRAAGAAGAAGARDPARPRRRARPRGDGPARPRVRARRRQTAASRSAATGSCCARCRLDGVVTRGRGRRRGRRRRRRARARRGRTLGALARTRTTRTRESHACSPRSARSTTRRSDRVPVPRRRSSACCTAAAATVRARALRRPDGRVVEAIDRRRATAEDLEPARGPGALDVRVDRAEVDAAACSASGCRARYVELRARA